MLIGSIIFITTFMMILISIHHLKTAYREYDRKETLKENIIGTRAKIKQFQDYFRKTYDHNVYNNIKLNIDFCLKIILNKDQEEELRYLKTLYETLYETGYRLKSRYDDVNYILAPMKNLRERLFEEQMDYIKENVEGL